MASSAERKNPKEEDRGVIVVRATDTRWTCSCCGTIQKVRIVKDGEEKSERKSEEKDGGRRAVKEEKSLQDLTPAELIRRFELESQGEVESERADGTNLVTSPWATLPNETIQNIVLRLDRRSRENFAATSKAMNLVVKGAITVWDVSQGDFNSADREKQRRPRKSSWKPLTSCAVTAITADANCEKNELKGHQLLMLKRMTLALVNKSFQFRRLELHKIPLLTQKLLRLLIPQMPNLDVLSIHCCSLITIADTDFLLRLIREGPHKNSSLQLDFYPSLRITHWRNVDLTLAITTYLYRILPHALETNSGLMTFRGGFHSWLDECMARSRSRISWKLIQLIEKGCQDESVVEEVSGKKLTPQQAAPKPGSTATPISAQWFKCRTCDETIRGCFFPKTQIRRSPDEPECWGCRLIRELDEEYRQKDGIRQLHRYANSWMGAGLDLKAMISAARADNRTQVENDLTWADEHRKREDQKQYNKLVAQGKIKRGDPIPGRYKWAKIPAARHR
ncbi:MAG: hypothetical protein M4579_004930 [Chaenotheca gracillima]|nr:MAG: hypothetical protein M4579_004930 [Chaenotheca gracillima]